MKSVSYYSMSAAGNYFGKGSEVVVLHRVEACGWWELPRAWLRAWLEEDFAEGKRGHVRLTLSVIQMDCHHARQYNPTLL